MVYPLDFEPDLPDERRMLMGNYPGLWRYPGYFAGTGQAQQPTLPLSFIPQTNTMPQVSLPADLQRAAPERRNMLSGDYAKASGGAYPAGWMMANPNELGERAQSRASGGSLGFLPQEGPEPMPPMYDAPTPLQQLYGALPTRQEMLRRLFPYSTGDTTSAPTKFQDRLAPTQPGTPPVRPGTPPAPLSPTGKNLDRLPVAPPLRPHARGDLDPTATASGYAMPRTFGGRSQAFAKQPGAPATPEIAANQERMRALGQEQAQGREPTGQPTRPSGPMHWYELAAALRNANPNASPELIGMAVMQFAPLLHKEAQLEMRYIMQQMGMEQKLAQMELSQSRLELQRAKYERDYGGQPTLRDLDKDARDAQKEVVHIQGMLATNPGNKALMGSLKQAEQGLALAQQRRQQLFEQLQPERAQAEKSQAARADFSSKIDALAGLEGHTTREKAQSIINALPEKTFAGVSDAQKLQMSYRMLTDKAFRDWMLEKAYGGQQ